MVFSKKYCPIWVYDCIVSQSVSDFILYGVDLQQPCRKFASGLSDLFEEVSLEELVRASEIIVQFLVEEKINENSVDLLSNFSFFRFYYVNKTTRRKFGGILGSKLSDSVREYSGNETLKNFKAYYYETRSDFAIVGSPGWSLATQTELTDLQAIARNSSFNVNPMAYLETKQVCLQFQSHFVNRKHTYTILSVCSAVVIYPVARQIKKIQRFKIRLSRSLRKPLQMLN